MIRRRLLLGCLATFGILARAETVYQDGDWVGLPVSSTFYEIRVVDSVAAALRFEPRSGYDHFVEFCDALASAPVWTPLSGGPFNDGLVRDQASAPGRFYRLILRPNASSAAAASAPRLRTEVQPLTRVEHTETLVLAQGFSQWHVRVDVDEVGTAGPIWRTVATAGPELHHGPFWFPDLPRQSQFRLMLKPAFDRASFETILVGGQSNALLPPGAVGDVVAGVQQATGDGELAPLVRYRADAQEPFQFSFAIEAAQQVRSRVGRDCLLLPVAVGSTSIRDWLPGADRFDRRRLYGGANWLRFLWAPQGPQAIWYYGHETSMEASDATSTYATDWRQLVHEFRQDCGQVPFVYAQVAKSTRPDLSHSLHLGAEIQRSLESGQANGIAQHPMVVTFDLPLADHIHLAPEGHRMLGERFALATLQHVYGFDVDGTGPRLVRLYHPLGDRNLVQVEFTQEILPAVNSYDYQFRVFNATGELEVLQIQRAVDPRSVRITVANPGGLSLEVSYGDRPAEGLHQTLGDVVRNARGLPAPQFSRQPVTSDPMARR